MRLNVSTPPSMNVRAAAVALQRLEDPKRGCRCSSLPYDAKFWRRGKLVGVFDAERFEREPEQIAGFAQIAALDRARLESERKRIRICGNCHGRDFQQFLFEILAAEALKFGVRTADCGILIG